MTQQVSSEEIKAAGGLDEWMRKQANKRTVAVVPGGRAVVTIRKMPVAPEPPKQGRLIA